jgi:hypothetical protein
MGATEQKLKPFGAESIGIVVTEPDNARLYFKFRPTRLRLATDPELITHHAYRLPKPAPTPEFMRARKTTRISPFGELPEPLPIDKAVAIVRELDGYKNNATDHLERERQWPQLWGQFLIDPHGGVVRWANIECAAECLVGIGKFASVYEIIAAARALPRA